MKKNSEAELNDAEALQALRDMKHQLKQLSKNQLIQLLFQQANFAQEQQNINKVLLEKLKETKLEETK